MEYKLPDFLLNENRKKPDDETKKFGKAMKSYKEKFGEYPPTAGIDICQDYTDTILLCIRENKPMEEVAPDYCHGDEEDDEE